MGGAEGRRGIHLRRNNKIVSLATSPRQHIGRIEPWGSSRSSPPPSSLGWGARGKEGDWRRGRVARRGCVLSMRLLMAKIIPVSIAMCLAAQGEEEGGHCGEAEEGGGWLAWSLPCVGVDPRWSITLQSRNEAQEQSNLDCGWSGGGDESSILRRFSRKRRRSWRSVMPESRPPRSSL